MLLVASDEVFRTAKKRGFQNQVVGMVIGYDANRSFRFVKVCYLKYTVDESPCVAGSELKLVQKVLLDFFNDDLRRTSSNFLLSAAVTTSAGLPEKMMPLIQMLVSMQTLSIARSYFRPDLTILATSSGFKFIRLATLRPSFRMEARSRLDRY